ncbi:TPM domain-containing protein [Lederbergia lenta]|uniref:Domain of uncharacterized function (DUF477) n=1 Tax=Lederbergia lenta TaxID=1467 RepID=A0A2X4WJ77_LEDLE|nr:TPM domain-containing protein [Lederbergia lenta]MCM3109432.1 TPM domain-containing protein [Lederbergia lenta]MEC2324803.1 TPM domain-containing protein [Lederbergia lenta]SQI57620.1 Domain of uncharacterised function (DUF477) [Lederbergia lenta]
MKPVHSIFPSFLIILFCLLSNQAHAANVPAPVGDIYIQDFAEVLSKEQKKELNELGTLLDEQTGAQIVILSVDSLQGQQVEEFALEAFRQYKLGDAQKNNGVLLLLALNDRKIRIEVGYGLEGALPDGKVGRILQSYALPYLEEENFSMALMNTYKQLFNEVSAEYKLDNRTDTKAFEPETSDGPSLITIIIFSLIALGIVFLDMRFLGGALTLSILRMLAVILSRGGGGGNGPRGGGGGSSGGGGASRGW